MRWASRYGNGLSSTLSMTLNMVVAPPILQGERQDGERGESGLLAQAAEAVAEIPQDRMHKGSDGETGIWFRCGQVGNLPHNNLEC